MTLLSLWTWWWREIEGLSPKKQAVATWQNGRISLAGETGGSLLLRLPEQKIWQRQFTMPRSAKPFLRQIFQNEMDRRTPWRADQVYFHLGAERQNDELAVTLSLLPKAAVEPALAELARKNLAADRLELKQGGPAVALADGQPVAIEAEGRARRRLVAIIVGAALLSLIGQNLTQLILDQRLDQVRSQAAATRSLAAENAKLARRQHFPSLRRQEVAPQLARLEALSRALPDDSWVEEISLKDGQVELTGISADPARLLGLLQANGFKDAEFKGPTIKAENGQIFHVSAHAP